LEFSGPDPSSPMTLREAADRTSRSITTLRRYIRAGRLRAEKRHGRYGPEYFVTAGDLIAAGFDLGEEDRCMLPARREPDQTALAGAVEKTLDRALRESVPLPLHQELLMKHEQLLVQYGMVRAAGMKVLDLQSELETRRTSLDDADRTIERLRSQLARETSLLSQRLRQAELALEGKRIEVATLREKVREFELLARNAVTTESVERQVAEVFRQTRRVRAMKPTATSSEHPGEPARPSGPPFLPNRAEPTDPGPDH